MRIEMLQTLPVSSDGLTTWLAKKGQCYDMVDELARMLVDAGVARDPDSAPSETAVKAAHEIQTASTPAKKQWPRRYGRGRRR